MLKGETKTKHKEVLPAATNARAGVNYEKVSPFVGGSVWVLSVRLTQ